MRKDISIPPTQHEQLKHEIIKIADAIKKKRLELKLDRTAEEEKLQKMYKPITEPLKKIAVAPPLTNINMKTIKTGGVKKEEKKEPQQADDSTIFPQTSILPEFAYNEDIIRREPVEEAEEEDDDAESYESLSEDYLGSFTLWHEYTQGFLHDTSRVYDQTYGVVYEPNTEELNLGNKTISFDGSDLIVGKTRYKCTRGLLELIFKRHPKDYNEDDEAQYYDILLRTSVHRVGSEPTERLRGTAAKKWTEVIKPILDKNQYTPSKSGSGVRKIISGLDMVMKNVPYQYVHWDDINELIDRLRLLVASQQAGHTNHNNEILSILEELREAGVIA